MRINLATLLIALMGSLSGTLVTVGAHATSLLDFFNNTTTRERSVAINLAITTQVYRYAAGGQRDTASCMMQNFTTTGSPDGRTPTALLSLMSTLTEHKDDPEKRKLHVEGYLVGFFDRYCPPPKQ
jgi:xanthine dehydrogenase iron-sulfur cluster and FAD-binding subunit A